MKKVEYEFTEEQQNEVNQLIDFFFIKVHEMDISISLVTEIILNLTANFISQVTHDRNNGKELMIKVFLESLPKCVDIHIEAMREGLQDGSLVLSDPPNSSKAYGGDMNMEFIRQSLRGVRVKK